MGFLGAEEDGANSDHEKSAAVLGSTGLDILEITFFTLLVEF